MAQITLNSTGVASSGALALQSNGTTTAVTIDTSQNVGIGTASPSVELEVGSGTGSKQISINGASSGTGEGSALLIKNAGTTIGAFGNPSAISGSAYSNILDLTSYYGLTFTTLATERMRIDSSGNVGIGTSSPVSKLHIESASAESFQIGYSSTKRARLGVTSSGDLQIYAYESAVGYKNIQMCVDAGTAGGNLLVGTTSALGGALFTVVGSFGAYLRSNGGAGNEALNLHNTATSGTIYQITFRDGASATSRGSVTTNGTGTAYNTTSDYRLKDNIAPMTGALDVVQALKPVTYNWKVDGTASQGFIAHELQEVVPDCVTGEKDAVDADGNPKYQGIDTSFLVATLTAAIQELKAIVDTQASTITTLTDRITALEQA